MNHEDEQALLQRGWQSQSFYCREEGQLRSSRGVVQIERYVAPFRMTLKNHSRRAGVELPQDTKDSLRAWNWRITLHPFPLQHTEDHQARIMPTRKAIWFEDGAKNIPLGLEGWCWGSLVEAAEIVEAQLEFFQELQRLAGRYTLLQEPRWER